MKVGARTLITFESAAEWRRARETKHTETIGSQREQSDQITAEKKDGRERASSRPRLQPFTQTGVTCRGGEHGRVQARGPAVHLPARLQRK